LSFLSSRPDSHRLSFQNSAGFGVPDTLVSSIGKSGPPSSARAAKGRAVRRRHRPEISLGTGSIFFRLLRRTCSIGQLLQGGEIRCL
jgi:hypothetical protein